MLLYVDLAKYLKSNMQTTVALHIEFVEEGAASKSVLTTGLRCPLYEPNVKTKDIAA